MEKNLKSLLWKSILIVFLILGVFSCSQNIDGTIKKEPLQFQFRAASELEGGTVTVTVNQEGVEPKVQSNSIKDRVTFSFGEYPSGTELSITAVVTNKDKVEVYRGSNNIVIGSGENLVTLNMAKSSIELFISPKLENSYENYRTSQFIVSVDGGSPKSVDIGKPLVPDTKPADNPIKDVKIPLGFLKIGKPIKIDAKIKKEDNIYYSYNGSYTPTGEEPNSTYELKNMVRNDGYFLWDGVSPTNKFNVYYGDLSPTASVMNKAKTLTADDFAVNAKGDVWVYNSNDGTIIYNAHGFDESVPGGFVVYNISEITGDDFSTPGTAFEIINMDAYKNGLFVYAGDATPDSQMIPSFYILTPDTQANKLVSKKVQFTLPTFEPSIESEIREMSNITVDGDVVYVVFNAEKPNTAQPDTYKPYFLIYKGSIANDSFTFDNNPVFNSLNLSNDFGADANIELTDLQVVDGCLYVLVTDFAIKSIHTTAGEDLYYSRNSRGALLKIGLSDKKVQVIGLYKNPDSSLTGTEYEDFDSRYMGSKEVMKNYFVGPRKFIAIKPKKIAIADDGAYLKEMPNPDPYVPEGSKVASFDLAKRVVTVDLETLALESVDLNNPAMFYGKIGTNCGYNYFIPN